MRVYHEKPHSDGRLFMEEINKVKYIHLIWHNELKFSTRLVEMLNDSANEFCSSEHLFVTPHPQVYKALKEYENVVLDTSFGSQKSAAYINRYAPQCDWLFVHFMCSPAESLKIKRAYLHKIILRTWGGDLGYDLTVNTGVKKLMKFIINKLYARRMKHIRLIGIVTTVDFLNVKERIGDVATYNMPYPVKGADRILLTTMSSPRKVSDRVNVMIGHSGHPYNNHKMILDALYRFREENIQIYIIVAYGRPEYTEEIKLYGKQLYGDKITFLEKMLPYNQYVALMNDMDIAFFDAKISYALGNISILKLLKKKIFLNKDGVIRRAFDLDGVPYMCTSDLKSVSFEEFAKPMVYSEEICMKLAPVSYEKSVQTWHEILSMLEKKR